jgi:hypothetical protein
MQDETEDFMFKSAANSVMQGGVILFAACAGTVALRLYSLGWRAWDALRAAS